MSADILVLHSAEAKRSASSATDSTTRCAAAEAVDCETTHFTANFLS